MKISIPFDFFSAKMAAHVFCNCSFFTVLIALGMVIKFYNILHTYLSAHPVHVCNVLSWFI